MTVNAEKYSFEKLGRGIKAAVSTEHTFGTDAFLLTEFSSVRHKDKVCDLGTGCGIIPLLMDIEACPQIIYGVDISAQAIEQLTVSAEASGLSNIVPICCDLKELWSGFPAGQLDVVTCNPPYKAENAGIQSELSAERIARHEVMCTINDVCQAAKRLLKFGGRLCLCNRPERLADVITAMRQNNIEPKALRFVSKTPNDAPWLFLIEGKLGSKPFMKILPQLYMHSGGTPIALMKYYSGEKD